MGYGNLQHGGVLTFLHQWLMSLFLMSWRKSNKLKSLSRIQPTWALWYCCARVCVCVGACVCLREKGINNSHQSSTSCLSQQLVCRRAVRIINYTHYIITVNSCQAGRASIQITSLSQVFFNNMPPFQSPWPFAPQGTTRNMTGHLNVVPPQPQHRPPTTPCSSHCCCDLRP